MATRYRQLANGFLTAPKRGCPPPIPEGYERYGGDPYIFSPKLENCMYREKREPTSRCCGHAQWLYCQLLKRQVIRFTCMRCEKREATS